MKTKGTVSILIHLPVEVRQRIATEAARQGKATKHLIEEVITEAAKKYKA